MDRCQLCGADTDLADLAVPPDASLLACGTCRAQLAGGELDPRHWFCLQESAWSEVPAVQVVAWRLLHRLREHGWAHDLLDQLYLDDETLAWARSGVEADPAKVRTVDSNGTELVDGDSVTLIKDLDVKGTSFVAKRGTLVKGIRLTDDPGAIEGRVNKTTLVLKTDFLKKA